MKIYILLFLAVFLVWSHEPVWAQQPDTAKAETPQYHQTKLGTQVHIMLLNALAFSATTGKVVSDLTADNFIVSENNAPQDLFAFHRPPANLALLIVVDTIASNTGGTALNNQIAALKSSLNNRLGAKDLVCIMALGEPPTVLQDYTSDKQLINAALDRVSQHKMTSKLSLSERLSGGLEEAAKHIRDQNSEACSAVILLSDSAEKTNDLFLSPEAARAMIAPMPILFCWAGFSHTDLQATSEVKYSLDKISLASLVSLTGGEFVNRDWEPFLDHLRGRYTIAYLPFAGRGGDKVLPIKLKLSPSTTHDINDLVLIYPRIVIIPSVK